MENKLLFNQVIIGSEGKKRWLGKVLGENPDIAVLIEGHTDNDPMRDQDLLQTTGIYRQKSHSIVTILSK
jgi:chemotaxis protein MotB